MQEWKTKGQPVTSVQHLGSATVLFPEQRRKVPKHLAPISVTLIASSPKPGQHSLCKNSRHASSELFHLIFGPEALSTVTSSLSMSTSALGKTRSCAGGSKSGGPILFLRGCSGPARLLGGGGFPRDLDVQEVRSLLAVVRQNHGRLLLRNETQPPLSQHVCCVLHTSMSERSRMLQAIGDDPVSI